MRVMAALMMLSHGAAAVPAARTHRRTPDQLTSDVDQIERKLEAYTKSLANLERESGREPKQTTIMELAAHDEVYKKKIMRRTSEMGALEDAFERVDKALRVPHVTDAFILLEKERRKCACPPTTPSC